MIGLFAVMAGLWASQGVSLAQSNDLSMAYGMLNGARAYTGVQPLYWNDTLVAYAEYWAQMMASGQQPFSHAQGIYRADQGENIFESAATTCDETCQNPMQAAMRDWLAEGALYPGGPVSSGNEPWLHWSQALWRSSVSIGCASAYGHANPYQVYSVCRFYPQGNVLGETPF